MYTIYIFIYTAIHTYDYFHSIYTCVKYNYIWSEVIKNKWLCVAGWVCISRGVTIRSSDYYWNIRCFCRILINNWIFVCSACLYSKVQNIFLIIILSFTSAFLKYKLTNVTFVRFKILIHIWIYVAKRMEAYRRYTMMILKPI